MLHVRIHQPAIAKSKSLTMAHLGFVRIPGVSGLGACCRAPAPGALNGANSTSFSISIYFDFDLSIIDNKILPGV